jgi:hypothetical protein
MKPRINTILPLAVIAGIALSASAGAATIVTDFKAPDVYNYSPNHYPEGLASSIGFGVSASPFTFQYDLKGLGLGAADQLQITVASDGGQLVNGGGQGIAVSTGEAGRWEGSDGPLRFSVVIRDAGNVDITSSYNVDLIGASLRWVKGETTDATFSIAGSEPFSCSPDENHIQNFMLPTGETNETAFSATRNNDSETQFAQLVFEIVPKPTSAR